MSMPLLSVTASHQGPGWIDNLSGRGVGFFHNGCFVCFEFCEFKLCNKPNFYLKAAVFIRIPEGVMLWLLLKPIRAVNYGSAGLTEKQKTIAAQLGAEACSTIFPATSWSDGRR